MSPDGKVVRTNRRADENLGGLALEANAYKGMGGWWSVTGLRVQRQDWPGARALRQRETVAPRLMRVRPQPGVERHFNCGAAPLLTANGTVLGAVISAMNMTKEIALQE